MWIKLKNGMLYNLIYAEKIYACKLHTGKWALCVEKKVFTEREDPEIIRIQDGFETEKEAYEWGNIIALYESNIIEGK